MNTHKIAFIACVNDDYEFGEALSYIEDLSVPEGYETDIIAIREAPSMAAGYNAGMRESDAKYKIYIHQDVFLIYRDLLRDMIQIFQSDETIGMIGTLGCRVLPQNAHAISRWDTGRVLCNGEPCYFHGYQKKALHGVSDVMAIDGMFMATQYDIEWREDIFDGWDFYDISQSCEFARNGKRVVIPHQKEYWAFHDNKNSKLGRFDFYRYKYIKEYQDIYPFKAEEQNGFSQRDEYEALKADGLKMMEELIDTGRMDEVSKMLLLPENQGFFVLREIELICRIYASETALGLDTVIYKDGMSYNEVYTRYKGLRHLIKRIEFRHGDYEENCAELLENYSTSAVAIMLMTHVVKCGELYEEILSVYKQRDRKQYLQFCEYQKLFAKMERRGICLQVVKENGCNRIDKKRMIIVEQLGEREAAELIPQYDKDDNIIFAEQYTADAIGQIRRARVLCGNVVKLVAELQDSLYTDYKSLVVYGNGMEEYVKLFQDTEIPVIWYTTGDYSGNFLYSDNIKICSKERMS